MEPSPTSRSATSFAPASCGLSNASARLVTMNITSGPYSANVEPVHVARKQQTEYEVVVHGTERPCMNSWRIISKRPYAS